MEADGGNRGKRKEGEEEVRRGRGRRREDGLGPRRKEEGVGERRC